MASADNDVAKDFFPTPALGDAEVADAQANRVGRLSRERIRQRLASNGTTRGDQNSHCPQLVDNKNNLSLCFVNEALSEEETEEEADEVEEESESEEEEEEEETAGSESDDYNLDKLSAKYIAKNNISKKKNHVIIPLGSRSQGPAIAATTPPPPFPPPPSSQVLTPSPFGTPDDLAPESPSSLLPATASADSGNAFSVVLARIQIEAREQLKQVRIVAKQSKDCKKEQKLLSQDLAKLVGLKVLVSRKLNRQMLTDMNIAQLQVILNYLLSRIEDLNEKLVQYLMTRDELVMEQDSLLTDIEDITKGINA